MNHFTSKGKHWTIYERVRLWTSKSIEKCKVKESANWKKRDSREEQEKGENNEPQSE